MIKTPKKNKEFGDFQTPSELVDLILKVLGPVGEFWPRVLEPTCGTGNFVAGLLKCESPSKEILGFEIQQKHLEQAKRSVRNHPDVAVEFKEADIFQTDLRTDLTWKSEGPLLVVGNPPWITNSELGCLQSNNLPVKNNLRKLSGIAALTGESNFDLGEALWIKILAELGSENPTIAFLCKMSVARNVLRFIIEKGISVRHAEIRRIDARKWFSASVEACLFIVRVGDGPQTCKVPVYNDLCAAAPDSVLDCERLFGKPAGGDSIPSELDITWRQGIKHDAASIMELTWDNSGVLRNKLGEPVVVEPEFLYPLLKSSDLFNGREPRKYVIVTQKRIGDDTDLLKSSAPMLWKYLLQHKDVFARRKSTVFKNRPDFAIFGVGDYSFAEYKIAIAGLYGEPRFRVLKTIEDKPVMLDDTCYFAACDTEEQAEFAANLLNSPKCVHSLKGLIFKGAKRPVTKSILERIGFSDLL